jgi:hypothetical protein
MLGHYEMQECRNPLMGKSPRGRQLEAACTSAVADATFPNLGNACVIIIFELILLPLRPALSTLPNAVSRRRRHAGKNRRLDQKWLEASVSGGRDKQSPSLHLAIKTFIPRQPGNHSAAQDFGCI